MADDEQEETVEKVKEANKSRNRQLTGINIVGKIVGVLVILWLVSVSYYAFAFFCIGMLPTIVTMMIDRGSGRFASKTVSACNFTGIMPYIFDIAMTHERDIVARHFIDTPSIWIYIYLASTVGLLMTWIFPQISWILFAFRADYKVNKLRVEQDELLDEWGDDLKATKKALNAAKRESREAAEAS